MVNIMHVYKEHIDHVSHCFLGKQLLGITNFFLC